MADITLLEELDAGRDAFLEALSDVDAALVTVSGVVDDWSVRDLVVHVAAWNEHGSSALELAAAGRGQEFAYARDQTDAMNEGFLAEAQATSPMDALRREAESFDAFRARIAALPPSLFAERLGNGDTVEAVIRYDGPEHYAEHTEHLRSWFGHETDDDDDSGV